MAAPYYGDYPTSAVVEIKWDTNDQTGASITRSTDGTLKIYFNASTVERSSLAGVTQTEDFDAATGVHHITIDTSDNTDAGFYAAGREYQVVMTGMTIDTKSVSAAIAGFSIERTGAALALLKHASYGLAQLVRSTTPANTFDVSATGEAGLDFANIKDATGAHTLTNITVPTVTTTTTATNLTNAPTSGDLTATMKTSVTSACTSSTPTAAGVTAGVTIAAGGIGSGAHAAAELNAIADAALDRNMTTGTDSGTDSTVFRTMRQALRALRNKATTAAGTLTVRKEDDVTASWTAAVTTTAGNPISEIDPT